MTGVQTCALPISQRHRRAVACGTDDRALRRRRAPDRGRFAGRSRAGGVGPGGRGCDRHDPSGQAGHRAAGPGACVRPCSVRSARDRARRRDRAGASGDRDPEDADASPPIEIAVRYGGADGPDLEAVADLHGLRPADVADLHASAPYRVLFLGFAPGFGYLAGLPPSLSTPRRASPRERVPAGSVGIAGEQTAVYPLAMPGGWQLIGRTDAVLFDPTRDPPALLRPGAAVRFVPARD